MESARRMTMDTSGGDPVDVELFWVCIQVYDGFKRLHLVRADSKEDALRAVKWDHPGGDIRCTGQYGIAENADGVVFSCAVQ